MMSINSPFSLSQRPMIRLPGKGSSSVIVMAPSWVCNCFSSDFFAEQRAGFTIAPSLAVALACRFAKRKPERPLMPYLNAITGATGLLGSHIAEQLAARGERVRALVRPTSDTTFLQRH